MVSQLEQVFAADKQKIYESEAGRVPGNLIQLDRYVGDVYSISYETALVPLHDKHRQDVGGIPSLSFLYANENVQDA